MDSNNITSSEAKTKSGESWLRKLTGFLIDLKYLVKGKVLIANVLPVFTCFWLALYFTGNKLTENWGLFFLTLIGSTLVIAGALMINNWYEVDLDKKMKRTQKRPTVTGNFSLNFVLGLGIATSIAGLGMMLFTTLEATIYSFLGWFVYVVLYTFWSKRRYTLNTIIGSVSGAFTPLIGWAAITPANHIIPITMFVILFIWQVPHTMAITIKRYDDYKAAGVPMLPVVKGLTVTKWQNFIYIVCLLPLPILLIPYLGTFFAIFTIVLTVLWAILAAKGFETKDNWQWAQKNLIFSLIYLVLTSFVIVLLTWSKVV